MTSNWYLVLMFVLVVIGISAGLGMAFWLNEVTDGVLMGFGGGIGTIVVLFGSCALCVFLCYLVGSQIEKYFRTREGGPEPKTYDEKVRAARKNRVKQKKR